MKRGDTIDGTIYDERDIIIRVLSEYKDDIFNVTYINKYITQITLPNKTKKYMVHELIETYTDIEASFKYMTSLKKMIITENLNINKDLMFIPFYRAISGYDIGDFIMGKPGNIPEGLDLDIDFSIVPANFNYRGLEKFAYDMENIFNAKPVHGSKNSFEYYINYFKKKIQEKEYMIERILPLHLIKMYPENKAIQEIFKAMENIDKKE